MNSSQSSIRYAQALLDLASENGSTDAVAENMERFIALSRENRDLELMLASPVIRGDKKLAVLNEVFGDFERVSATFMQLIVKNGRENNLPEIAEAYISLVKEKKGIVPVTITSAAKLDDAVRNEILAKIQPAVKGTPEVTEVIDPELIGGFTVRMGDFQIDASVASKLGQLKQRLTR
jgi:F-type H+-transporting ATPase subunit delta